MSFVNSSFAWENSIFLLPQFLQKYVPKNQRLAYHESFKKYTKKFQELFTNIFFRICVYYYTSPWENMFQKSGLILSQVLGKIFNKVRLFFPESFENYSKKTSSLPLLESFQKFSLMNSVCPFKNSSKYAFYESK